METFVANLSASKARRVTENGKNYIVVPVSMIVPGVLNGSKGALYYPPEQVANNYEQWNGQPLVVYHPVVGGKNVSAKHPGVLEKSGVGVVRNSRITKTGRLVGECWFDEEATKRVDSRIHSKLIQGQPIEISTGLFTTNNPAPFGSNHNGRMYDYVAVDYVADHLAILPDQVGACSIKDGCGANVTINAEKETTPEDERAKKYKEHGKTARGTAAIQVKTAMMKGDVETAKTCALEYSMKRAKQHSKMAEAYRKSGNSVKAQHYEARAAYHEAHIEHLKNNPTTNQFFPLKEREFVSNYLVDNGGPGSGRKGHRTPKASLANASRRAYEKSSAAARNGDHKGAMLAHIKAAAAYSKNGGGASVGNHIAQAAVHRKQGMIEQEHFNNLVKTHVHIPTTNANPQGINQYTKGGHGAPIGTIRHEGQAQAHGGYSEHDFRAEAKARGHTIYRGSNGRLTAKNSKGEAVKHFAPAGTDHEYSKAERKSFGIGHSSGATSVSEKAYGYSKEHRDTMSAYKGKDVGDLPAMESAREAEKAARGGLHGIASHFHLKSAEEHEAIAKDSKTSLQDRAQHERAAGVHREASDYHSKVRRMTTNRRRTEQPVTNEKKPGWFARLGKLIGLTQNQTAVVESAVKLPDPVVNNEEPKMAFKPIQRKAMIDSLVANCSCKEKKEQVFNEEDRPMLEAMDDAGLLAMVQISQAGKQPVVNSGENTEVEEPTDNKETPMAELTKEAALKALSGLTAEEFLSIAPASIRETVVNAQNTVNKAKADLILKITANMAEGELKTRQVARFSKMGIDELEDFAATVATAPVQNQEIRTVAQYIGAAGATPVGNAAPVVNKEKVAETVKAMTPPRFDWAEMAANNAGRKN